MADILITGGAGSFGKMVASLLREKGHSIRIFDLPACDYSFCREWEKTKVFPGNILDVASLKEAVKGADQVFHLAAILPPASEVDRSRTFNVNVQGTKILLDTIGEVSSDTSVVFTSSVHVYGNTSAETGLIGPDYPVHPDDWYAESKVDAEQVLFSSGLNFVNLRISGVVIPAFLDPPEPWAFQENQRIELICLKDLAHAIAALPDQSSCFGKTLILAGGKTWQTTGIDYVTKWGKCMDIPLEDMRFLEHPGWFNWYDTAESQRLLGYQKTSLDDFFGELDQAVQEALA